MKQIRFASWNIYYFVKCHLDVDADGLKNTQATVSTEQNESIAFTEYHVPCMWKTPFWFWLNCLGPLVRLFRSFGSIA